ncbi:hypothetical protein TI04_01900 [Achromatium sp. WMS2]|nr:hypothetical protein TI04_01900 [Achromatium sp. WMS2]
MPIFLYRKRLLRTIVWTIIVAATGSLALTALTAHFVRAAISNSFATGKVSQSLLKLNDITGDFIHTELGIGIESTQLEIAVTMQHYWLTSYIIGEINDPNLSAHSLASFSGYVSFKPWFRSIDWLQNIEIKPGNWNLPTGVLQNDLSSVKLHVIQKLDNMDFNVNIDINKLYFQGIPVIRIESIRQSINGNTQNDTSQYVWIKAITDLNLTSDYGTMRANASIDGPGDVAQFSRTGKLRLRAVIPDNFWSLVEQWQPNFASLLKSTGAIHHSLNMVIIDAILDNGQWQTPIPGASTGRLTQN